MYDYGLSTLTQYQLTVRTTARTRGALLCQTDIGGYIIREFKGSERKLKKQQELLLKMKEENKLIILASHNREDIEVLCDEVYEMEGGVISKVKDELKVKDGIQNA